MTYTLRKADRHVKGELTLAGSKSISNRALIIRALCGKEFPIHRLANAKDTQLLDDLLKSNAEIRDAGAAGTTFRFLTAYLSLRTGVQVLTGTDRMKQRPVGVLVEALRKLGARIEYLEKEGYPPLRIGEPGPFGNTGRLAISAGTSSQYISALLMIAPVLPSGLELILEGRIVSRSYIEMTLALMKYFGVAHSWEGNRIIVPPQPYEPRPFTVEADWSAASYHYALAAFGENPELQLNGLFSDSVQGDAVLPEMMELFGVHTEWNQDGICLTKPVGLLPSRFEWDFIRCPDLAQTLAVICGGLGVKGLFTGLETLRIKETDRIHALQTELGKLGVQIAELPVAPKGKSGQYFAISGKASLSGQPSFPTYEDHRMAMAFAPLAMFGALDIEEPEVVGKSYPDFWKDLEKLGFEVRGRGR